ncbi:MAG: DUF1643 domain-containing protein [Clostridia bacterium]|nr:DUF1643 domain-containing protein [Clostridia bacterium]
MRHIPAAATQQTRILPFEEALLPTNQDYDRDAWLYVPDHYSEYRYILGTRGQKPLICIGVNPSTAIPGRLDNTLKSAERIALFNGYDSFIMFNVYAQRATLPEDMDREWNLSLHAENMKAFRYALEQSKEAPAIWAAWGAVIEKRAYLPLCVREMIQIGREYGARWYTAGPRSKAGHPHHPLYLKKDSLLEPFTDLEAYLLSLEKS